MPNLFDTARKDIAPRKPLIKVSKEMRERAARLITRRKTGLEHFEDGKVILQSDMLAHYYLVDREERSRNHLLKQLAKGAAIEPGPLSIRNPLPEFGKPLLKKEGSAKTLIQRIAAQTRLKKNRKPARKGAVVP
jgi:hypothetical protein